MFWQDLALGRSPCLVGAKGAGKSAMVRLLGRVLDYSEAHRMTVHVYKDMGSRDLLLRRATNKAGSTVSPSLRRSSLAHACMHTSWSHQDMTAATCTQIWQAQALVAGALEGALVVLDGVHRLSPDTLAFLAPLLHDGVSIDMHASALVDIDADVDVYVCV